MHQLWDPRDTYVSFWGYVAPSLPSNSHLSPFLMTMHVHLGPLHCLALVKMGPKVGGLEANGAAMSSITVRLSGRTWHACV